MKQLLCLLLIVTVASNTLLAQTKDEKAVAAAVENLRKAMVDPTKDALTNLTTAQLSYGHSSGKIENQAQFIEALVSGKSDFLNIDLSEQTIKVIGNTGIVRHILTANTSDNGKANTAHIGILLVWVKQNNEWKLVARQAVKIPPATN
ncbi:MAG: nuclear transport factor 2 family protein [Chitinophagaceae bacterium]